MVSDFTNFESMKKLIVSDQVCGYLVMFLLLMRCDNKLDVRQSRYLLGEVKT